MADQHSARSRQAGKGTDMGEGNPLSDEMNMFDQLQNEFDALISGDAQDALPLETSAETVKDFGELFTPDKASDDDISPQEHAETDLAAHETPVEDESFNDNLIDDDQPDPESPTQDSEANEEITVSGQEHNTDDDQKTMPNEPDESRTGKAETAEASHEADASLIKETVDATPPLSKQNTVAETSDKTTQASTAKVSARHSKTRKKTSGMPASTIMMIALAVAILMAAVAGSIWTFNHPGAQQAASNGQAPKDLRQVIIKKPTRAAKYIPVDKAALITSKQSAVPAAKPVATATSRHASGQSAASHDKAGHASATPARNGDWIINLESFSAVDDANAYASKLTQHHIHADVIPVQIKGKAWYRVRLTGFPSKREAEIQRLILVKKLNLNSAWISKYRH